jgi:hypothetical protein
MGHDADEVYAALTTASREPAQSSSFESVTNACIGCTADHIHHHCKIAGRADTLFSDNAIALIHNAEKIRMTRAYS